MTKHALRWTLLAAPFAIWGALAMPARGACTSSWYVSYGGAQDFELLRVDPKGLPLSSLRFDRGYHDPGETSHGFLDFDGDGHSDVFATEPIGGGHYEWYYSSAGMGDWIDLGSASIPPDDLRFGDFDGDAKTDVFFVTPRDDGALQWNYSSGGVTGAIPLAYAFTPLPDLRLGDFDGDGTTDVFTIQPLLSGGYAWLISYGANSTYVQVNSASTALADMRFADVDGGGTDVITTVYDQAEGYLWYASSSATSAYRALGSNGLLRLEEVVGFGNFDANPNTSEALTESAFGDFGTWITWGFPGVNPVPSSLPLSDFIPPDQLRLADFDGDGITDVFEMVQTCPEPEGPFPTAAVAGMLALLHRGSVRFARASTSAS
ncbi:MAG TPA: VCBS repeat-containing protein [Myxococcota bacterium]|nr:VCBS repeat-containing protein [Myxococcota bacterium]